MDKLTQPHSTQKAFRRGVAAASGRVHKVIDGASHAVSPAIKQMTNTAHHTVNKMADGAHYAADAISHKGEQLHHLQQQLTKKTVSQVRRHPLLAIGIIVASGVLVSWWLSRRSSNRPDAS